MVDDGNHPRAPRGFQKLFLSTESTEYTEEKKWIAIDMPHLIKTFWPRDIIASNEYVHSAHLLPNLGSSTVYPWLDQDAAQDLCATEDSTVFPSRRSSERVKRADST